MGNEEESAKISDDYFLNKGGLALDAAVNGKNFNYLINAIKNPPFPPTPNKKLAVLVPCRIWAMKYGGPAEKAETREEVEKFMSLQEEFGHNTFGEAQDDCEQMTTNHIIQYTTPYTGSILMGRRLKDDLLVQFGEEWLARELYVYERVDHFKTLRVVCAGARTREKPGGLPVCENIVRNQFWMNYLGNRKVPHSKQFLRTLRKEGWIFPDPKLPKFRHPMEIRIDPEQRRVLTFIDGGIPGSDKRGWDRTDYTAGKNPVFTLPDNYSDFQLLEKIG